MKFSHLFMILLFICSGTVLFSEEQSGEASWYGGKYHGRTTASGEIFDTYDFTAAHRTLPFGTIVRVTNQRTGKEVTVRINDRGPFVEGRIIDLSYAAAEQIGLVKEGIAPVTIYWGEEEKVSYTIQLGAFRNIENVQLLKRELLRRGLSPVSELNNQGIIRVMLLEIPENQTYPIVHSLDDLDLGQILIRQN